MKYSLDDLVKWAATCPPGDKRKFTVESFAGGVHLALETDVGLFNVYVKIVDWLTEGQSRFIRQLVEAWHREYTRKHERKPV